MGLLTWTLVLTLEVLSIPECFNLSINTSNYSGLNLVKLNHPSYSSSRDG